LMLRDCAESATALNMRQPAMIRPTLAIIWLAPVKPWMFD